MRKLWLGALVLSSSMLGSAAAARDWGTFSGWEVSSNDDEHSCYLGREHEGPGSTVMGLGTNLDQKRTTMFVANYNWTVKEDEVVKIAMRLDGVTGYVYTGNAVGFSSDGRNGLAIGMNDPDFLRDFAKASGIKFFKVEGDEKKPTLTVVDYLNLDGTQATVAAFQRCVAHERSLIAADQRERDRWKAIPDDPFHKDPN